MAAAADQVASTSICVSFSPGEYPRTLEEAAALFAHLGAIARIDITLGRLTGRVFITFFDIRCAAEALLEFGASAERLPPAALDFRAVSVAASAFAELPPRFAGLEAFGEIAGVSVYEGKLVVEFWDMRAAQQLCFSVPGCKPSTSLRLASVPGDRAAPQGQAHAPISAAAAETASDAAAFPGPPSLHGLLEKFPCLDHNMNVLEAQASSELGYGDYGSHSPPSNCPVEAGFWAHASAEARSPPTWVADAGDPLHGCARDPLRGPLGARAAGGEAAAAEAAPRRPTRAQVGTKDRTKFDIEPALILAGYDNRTTVMIRNLPKAFTRERLVQLLASDGLQDRYTFLYMPFDKRRATHCGLAFVNFREPSDVLKFHNQGLHFAGSKITAMPAISYARLQGPEQLAGHFHLSAVMKDSDSRMRPQFFGAGAGPMAWP